MNRSIGQLLIATLVACALRGFADSQPVKLDGYAAMVNDKVITVGDVMEYIQPTDDQLTGLYSGSELDTKRHEAFTNGLETLIEHSLIIADFNKQGGTIPDRMVNDRVNEFIYERFKNDRAAFLDALSEQQVTLETWREQVKERLIINILRRQEVLDHIAVSPALVRETYDAHIAQYRTEEQYHLLMIMLNKGDNQHDHDIKREEADKLLARIKAGEDFGDIARTNSEGSKASDGGDLGWVKPADLRADLRAPVAALKPGEISGVIDAGDEFYIFKMEEHHPAGVTPFEEVRQTIEDELEQADGERLYKAWTDRLRRKYYVQVFDTEM